jgi:hypothetical protein
MKTVMAVGTILISFAFVANSARADSIRLCSSEVAAPGHFASCGAVSGPGAISDSLSSAQSFSTFSASDESLLQRESSPRLGPMSGSEDRSVADIFAAEGFGAIRDNGTRIHGIGRIFEPEPSGPVSGVSSSTVPVPEPSSLPLAALGLMGIALFGGSFRRKRPLPRGTV